MLSVVTVAGICNTVGGGVGSVVANYRGESLMVVTTLVMLWLG